MKKGFTLIELIAVVVIFAIISSLTIIITINIIDAARTSAYKTSVLGAMHSFDNLINVNGENLSEIDVTSSSLPLENNNFISGSLIYNSDTKLVTANLVSDGIYCADGERTNLIVVKGSCDLINKIKASHLEVNPSEVTIYAGNEYDFFEGVALKSISGDNINVVISYESDPFFDNTLEGNYEIEYKTIYRGITYKAYRTITVIAEGVTLTADPETVTIYKDSSYSLLSGVTLKDKDNNIIESTITYSSDPTFTSANTGIYYITYTSTYHNVIYTALRTVSVIQEGVHIETDPDIVYLPVGINYDLMTGVNLKNISGDILASTITYTSSPSFNYNAAGTYNITYTTTYSEETYTKIRTVIYINAIYNFTYTGSSQSFTAPAPGSYKLEVWGAQGGTDKHFATMAVLSGGKGGYSTGYITLAKNEKVYIYVGEAGINGDASTSGGYNGGGNAGYYGYSGGGGGATHIAKTSGLLSTLSSNRSTIIIVAGGGGGAGSLSPDGLSGHGGGLSGTDGYNSSTNGASQTAAGTSPNGNGTFGKGATHSYDGGGGGGGYYGGGAGNDDRHGGGGSGYIGGVTSGSTSAGTRSGNGYARITYVG